MGRFFTVRFLKWLFETSKSGNCNFKLIHTIQSKILPSKSSEKHENGCMEPREFKITFMLSLVLGYFCVEMFVGYRYNSLALVADACHMLSDGLCLVVALGTVFGRQDKRLSQPVKK